MPKISLKNFTTYKYRQEEKGWCFAAVSQIVEDYVGGVKRPQWQIVAQFHKINFDQQLDMQEREDYVRAAYGEKFGIEQFENVKPEKAQKLTAEILTESLDLMNSPVIVGIANHSYVAYAYDTDTGVVTLWDPLEHDDLPLSVAAVNDLDPSNIEVQYSFQKVMVAMQ